MRRLLALFRRDRLERDLDEELGFHLAMRADERQRVGLDAAQSSLASRRQFGRVAAIKEQARDVWTFRWVEEAIQDTRFALRGFRRSPGVTLIVVLMLAVGIGGIAAMSGILNAVLVQSLPFENPNQLYVVSKQSTGQIRRWISVPELVTWRQQNRAFSRVAGFTHMDFNIRGERPEGILAVWASTDLLDVLGVRPQLGRFFRSEELEPSAPRVVVISHRLWQRRFGGASDVVGSFVDLEGPEFLSDSAGRYIIVGVLPETFWFFHPRSAELIVPMRTSTGQLSDRTQRLVEFVIGRLTDSTPEQARRDIATVARDFEASLPFPQREASDIEVKELRESHVGDLRQPLVLLFAAALFVAGIASINVALVLLARTAARRREFAVRVSLGADRARLMRQVMVEALFLAAVAGLISLLIATATIQVAILLIPSQVLNRVPGGAHSIVLGERGLAVTAVAALLFGIVAGFIPAVGACRAAFSRTVGPASAGWIGRRRLTGQGSLVVAQSALAIMLLVAAILLLKSLANLQRMDLGITPTPGLVVWLNLNPSRYGVPENRTLFYEQVIERLNAQPEIKAISGVDLPFLFDWQTVAFSIDPRQSAADAGRWPQALDRAVTPTYFNRHGIRVIQGRQFSDADDRASPQVAIVSQTFAQRFWSGRDPTGQRIRLRAGANFESATIIGVVTDIRDSPDANPQPIIYRSFRQHPPPWLYLTVEGHTSSTELLEPIRRAIWAVDPDQPVDGQGPWTLTDWISEETARPRLIAVLVNVFAAVAVVLTMIGIYGMLAYSVTRRTQEIGVRTALGARRAQIFGLVLGQGLGLTVIGIVLGLAGAGAITRYLEGMLFGVRGHDPGTFTAVAAIFALVSVLAAYVPARRATKVDPLVALRCE